MLWRVQGTHLALLGSVHLLDVENPPLSDEAWQEFNTATRIVFEHDFAPPPDVSFARLPPGQSLHTIVPPRLFQAVRERCQQLSLDVDVVNAFQPWFVAVSLVTEAAKEVGLLHSAGVDRKLWEQARQLGQAVEVLEETVAPLRMLSVAPVAEQQEMLRFAADPTAAVAHVRALVDAWKLRRADLLMTCAQERLALMPVMSGTVIEGRSRSWLPRLLALARDERHETLAVVGALHTVGPVGLPALLRAAGCNVVAVDVSGE